LREILDTVGQSITDLRAKRGEATQGEDADDLRLHDAEIVRSELGADDRQADLGATGADEQP
jgi:hypothetical protein